MKTLTKILSLGVLLGALAPAGAAEVNWLTDLPKALEQAKKEKQIVMINFTGSDWCGWCIRLKKEVFDTEEFAEYTKKNVVLVEADFPRRKQLSAEQKKANSALQEKYKIEGYPTLILLNAEGKQIGKMGYMRGGPKPFIEELDKHRKKA